MSRVFVAADKSLGHRIVVKVLPPELTAGVNRRFDPRCRRWVSTGSPTLEGEVTLGTRIFILFAIFFVLAATMRVQAQATDTAYTISAGTYSGTTIQVQRAAGLRRGSGFWRVAPKTDGRLVGWNPSRLPVGVAFMQGRGIDADDSVAFWKIVRGMEQDLGMHLFEPATVAGSDDPNDIVLIGIEPMRGDDGVTYVTWSNDGSVYDPRVFFRSREVFHDERVVQHEMMHALGFGHTSAWLSIMNVSPGARQLSAEDVAYAQVALESRAETERVDMWDRIASAVEHSSGPGGGSPAPVRH